jgi:hypothetical protein
MNEKKHSPLFGVGGVTLLTVLLVLALTMFAVLTLSSAQADMRLSEKNARAASDYYRADSGAVYLQAMAAELWDVGPPRPYLGGLASELGSLSVLSDSEVSVSEQGQGLMIYCDIPINSAGQLLQVALYLAPPENSERWRVEQWQVVPPPSAAGSGEPGLPVWIGE